MNKEQLFKQLQKEISDNPAVVDWGNSSIDAKTIEKAKKEYPEHPIDYFTSDSFIDYDYVSNLERDIVREVVKDNIPDICEVLAYDEDDFDVEDFIMKYNDELYEHTVVDYNLESLLGDMVNVMVVMHSNYDCINSHFFETYNGGYDLNSYFGDVVKTLKLNRKNIGKLLKANGIDKIGPGWINNKTQELVSHEQFWEEEENRSCGACLLVFVGQLKIIDYLTKKPSKVIIPKGNNCGYFSHWEGGGSIIEMELKHDFKVTLDKELRDGRSFKLFMDGERGYSIEEVYGVSDSFFGDEIKLV